MGLDRDTFGPYLRNARERRRITLDDIASRTKIARSLLAKLERGDLSDWPSGIYRRSFFREYTTAIGLDADALLADFLGAFPDPADPTPVPRERSGELRLTLDTPTPLAGVSSGSARRALVDTATIALASVVVSLVVGHVAAVVATIAILYHAVGTLFTGMRLAAPAGARAVARVPRAGEPVHTRVDSRRAESARRSAQPRRRAGDAVRNLPQPS